MRLSLLLMLALLTAVAVTSTATAYTYGFDPNKAAPAGDNYMYMELAQDPTQIIGGVHNGKYEYFFDLYTLANGSGSTFYFLHLVGLDNNKIANAETNRPIADGGGTVNTQRWGDPNGAYEAWPAATGRIMDLWTKDVNADIGSATAFDKWRSSYDDGAGGWADSGLGYADPSLDNPHAYSEYVEHSGAGVDFWKAELTGVGQPLHWWNTQFGVVPTQDTIYLAGATVWSTTAVPGLTMTLRVVYDDIIDPLTIGWSGDATLDNDILGDFTIYDPPVPGDFDGDDDVDADDIDILCANMGGDVGTYDMDGDLDVDEDDLIYHVENLVELQDGSGRVGTKRGDFNLDGFVNATDLAIMQPSFGLGPKLYADGNANCDTVVNGTDLAILAANIGFAAPTGAVPEPLTLGLLGLGSVALLRRRKS